MYLRLASTRLSSRFSRALKRRWRGVRVSWHVTDREPWIFALIVGLIATLLLYTSQAAFTYKETRQHDTQNLTCLARNVYFEARGEPMAGQYAVAEVTMNRWASGLFSDSICGVVYQKAWDPRRKRYVGAFSWTELDVTPMPAGAEWRRAWKVAEAVYYEQREPALDGALFYHATYIEPDWAKGKQQVARIGGHVFYK